MLVPTSHEQQRLLDLHYGFISYAIQLALARAYIIRRTMTLRPAHP